MLVLKWEGMQGHYPDCSYIPDKRACDCGWSLFCNRKQWHGRKPAFLAAKSGSEGAGSAEPMK